MSARMSKETGVTGEAEGVKYAVIVCFELKRLFNCSPTRLIIKSGPLDAAVFCLYHKDGFWSKYKFEDMTALSESGFVFWLLPLTKAELVLLWNTCVVCICRGLSYFAWDNWLRMSPFANLTEQRLLDIKTASPTQAVLMALRESIDTVNPMHRDLWALNSKSVTMDELASVVKKYGKQVVYSEVRELIGVS